MLRGRRAARRSTSVHPVRPQYGWPPSRKCSERPLDRSLGSGTTGRNHPHYHEQPLGPLARLQPYDLLETASICRQGKLRFLSGTIGVVISRQNANPNTPAVRATHTWNDQAPVLAASRRDKRWQPGEESAAPIAQALSGADHQAESQHQGALLPQQEA